eukprot:8644338-Heterocapsa_arctica.AAC.1
MNHLRKWPLKRDKVEHEATWARKHGKGGSLEIRNAKRTARNEAAANAVGTRSEKTTHSRCPHCNDMILVKSFSLHIGSCVNATDYA